MKSPVVDDEPAASDSSAKSIKSPNHISPEPTSPSSNHLPDVVPQPHDAPKKAQPVWRLVLRFILSQWFIIAIAIAVVLAYFFPDAGNDPAVVDPLKQALIIFIFFSNGLGIKTRTLKDAAKLWPLHTVIQLTCFAVAPALFYGFSRLQPDEALATGQAVLGCLPPAIASTVVMTAEAGGNEATAVLNATLGNIAGVILSPTLMLLLLGQASLDLPYGDILLKLAYTVIAPIIVGQIVQYFFPTRSQQVRTTLRLPKLSNLAIAIIVWTVFCRTFSEEFTISERDIGIVVGMNIGLFAMLVLVSGSAWWVLARVYPKADIRELVPTVFVGASKTVVLGITLVTLTYGSDPNQGIIAIPLLIYHPMTMVVLSIASQGFKWFFKRRSRKEGDVEEPKSAEELPEIPSNST